MSFRRLKERRGGEVIIHADCAHGDNMTLCGFAEEGPCDGGAEGGWIEVSGGKINCQMCVAIIKQCKAIPLSAIAEEAA